MHQTQELGHKMQQKKWFKQSRAGRSDYHVLYVDHLFLITSKSVHVYMVRLTPLDDKLHAYQSMNSISTLQSRSQMETDKFTKACFLQRFFTAVNLADVFVSDNIH